MEIVERCNIRLINEEMVKIWPHFQTAGDIVPAVQCMAILFICVCVTTFCLAKIETNTLLG